MTAFSKAIAALVAAVVIFLAVLIVTGDVDVALLAFSGGATAALAVLVAPANSSTDRR